LGHTNLFKNTDISTELVSVKDDEYFPGFAVIYTTKLGSEFLHQISRAVLPKAVEMIK